MGINPIPIEAHSMQANELVDLKPVTKDIDEDQKSTSPSVELPITLSRAYPPSSTSDKLAVPQRGAQMKPRITSIPRSAIVRTLLLHQQHSRTCRLARSYHHAEGRPAGLRGLVRGRGSRAHVASLRGSGTRSRRCCGAGWGVWRVQAGRQVRAACEEGGSCCFVRGAEVDRPVSIFFASLRFSGSFC